MKMQRIRFEWKLEDFWVGVFWKHGYANFDDGPKRMWTDIWICMIPCVPLHITVVYTFPILHD